MAQRMQCRPTLVTALTFRKVVQRHLLGVLGTSIIILLQEFQKSVNISQRYGHESNTRVAQWPSG